MLVCSLVICDVFAVMMSCLYLSGCADGMDDGQDNQATIEDEDELSEDELILMGRIPENK
jgi:protein involved in sex pheromone biosynthesis